MLILISKQWPLLFPALLDYPIDTPTILIVNACLIFLYNSMAVNQLPKGIPKQRIEILSASLLCIHDNKLAF